MIPKVQLSILELLEQKQVMTVKELEALEASLEVAALVRDKFRSGNEIDVERISISRKELEGWL